MENLVILVSLMFFVLILSNYVARKGRYKKRKSIATPKPTEASKKAALNIPGYYEDVVNKGKLKKSYKWELHESF